MSNFDEINLVDICSEIGLVAGSNRTFTLGLTEKIKSNGVPVDDLTIKGLLLIIRDFDKEFNAKSNVA